MWHAFTACVPHSPQSTAAHKLFSVSICILIKLLPSIYLIIFVLDMHNCSIKPLRSLATIFGYCILLSRIENKNIYQKIRHKLHIEWKLLGASNRYYDSIRSNRYESKICCCWCWLYKKRWPVIICGGTWIVLASNFAFYHYALLVLDWEWICQRKWAPILAWFFSIFNSQRLVSHTNHQFRPTNTHTTHTVKADILAQSSHTHTEHCVQWVMNACILWWPSIPPNQPRHHLYALHSTPNWRC